jgi:transposase
LERRLLAAHWLAPGAICPATAFRDDMKGFVVLPRRWVVERTFSWFGRNRCLARDFENLAATLGAFVALASIQLALRRLAGA